MRDSEADGSGVTPDSGRLGSPQGDFRRVAAPDLAAGAGSEPEADLRGALGPGGRWRRIADRLLGWRERLYATRIGRFGVKIVVAFAGTLVIAVGVVLLPLPGPGWLIILGGLAILAMEFHWARRLLKFTKRQLQRWTRLVREGSWLVRIVSVGGLLLVVGAALLLSLRMLA
ncbi:hypothetical protein GCM10009827_038720 [Dactylosporangium maewongense]|uniref:TIGR02611 family protein n=1 Tax=Dactylosporangium maewongense TaxID=634393 RepID=A0ABP4LCF2_9ACTN